MESKTGCRRADGRTAGSTSVVWAAEQEQAEKPAQEIVITANRLKNQKVDTPADVTVITSQQISDRGYSYRNGCPGGCAPGHG